MLKNLTAIAALLILGCALPAHADPLPYAFNAQGGYPSIGLTGTFQYDPTDGSVSGATLFFVFGGPSFPFTGTQLDDSSYLAVLFTDLVNGPMGTQGYTAGILLDIANPAAPTVCLYQGSCPYGASTIDEYFGGQRYGSFELTSGTLTPPPPPPPPSATPEPSSLLLLATGGLAVVGVARRRFR